MPILENDGCSLFPDQWAGKSHSLCCQIHDDAFASSRDFAEPWNAGMALHRCVRPISEVVAIIMLLGVISPVALILFLFGRKRGPPPNPSQTENTQPATTGFLLPKNPKDHHPWLH